MVLPAIENNIKIAKKTIEEFQKDAGITNVNNPTANNDISADTANADKNVIKLREDYLKLRKDVTETINKLSSFAFAFDKIS